MPSVRINPRDGTHLSYRQVQAKWLKELREARKASRLQQAAQNDATVTDANNSPSEQSTLQTNTPLSTALASPQQASAGPSSTAVAHVDDHRMGSPSPDDHQEGISPAVLSSNIPAAVSTPSGAIQLSKDQRRILDEVKKGRNVFFTGPAGTGKSVLLREIIGWARSHYGEKQVAVTASTGIAGLSIGGSTVHSFAGIGLGKESADKIASKILDSPGNVKKRWRQTRVMVIDEISMLDGSLFDKLDEIARIVRATDRPFGGIQLVLTGDFFQLPPVPDKSHNYEGKATFAFGAKQWPRCIGQPMFLRQVFRQTDNTFIDLLSSIRLGKLENRHIEILNSLQRPIHYTDGIGPTHLYPRKVEVEGFNNRKLTELPGPEFQYESTDSGGYDPFGNVVPGDSVRTLLERMIALSSVTLKIGAQVMLIQNVIQGKLVNGSTGKVVEFLTIHEALQRDIAIAELNEKPRRRHPGKDAKKKEDRSKDEILEDLTRQIQGTAHDYELRRINNNVFSTSQYWPLVRFTNGMELLCAPLAFTAQGFIGNIEAHRLQVPLILSWALSIHKSQGQTLDRVKVDLASVFENGQAYVALSRARTMEGLEVVNFDPSKIRADPRVAAWQEFYTSLGCDDDDFMDSEEAMRSYWDTD